MKITVTQRNIELGIACSADKCPIALAMNEAGYEDVLVFGNQVEWGTEDADCDLVDWAPLPQGAQEFIERFDNREPVTPFGFELKQL